MEMAGYIVRRLMWSVPVLLGITLVTFVMTRALPGNPIDRVMNVLIATPEKRMEMMQRYGYDQPLYLQYVQYLRNISHGDFGLSFTTSKNVFDDLNERLPATAELTVYSLAVGVVLGIALGLLAALKEGSVIDYAIRIFCVFGAAAPSFWLAIVLMVVFFYKLGWVGPPIGRIPVLLAQPTHITGFCVVDALLTGNLQVLSASVRALILPAVTLGVAALAPIARMTRSEALEVLSSDHVRAARALGLSFPTTVRHHVLKNSLLPVVTLVGIIFGRLLGGVVVVETVFSWPGLGLYAFNAAAGSDYPAIQGFVLYTTTVYVLVFLTLDILLAFLDPRIRY